MPHKRSPAGHLRDMARLAEYQRESKEREAALEFCRDNSKYDKIMKERVFVATPEKVEEYVKIVVRAVVPAWIPDMPQGLVLEDSRGRGADQ